MSKMFFTFIFGLIAFNIYAGAGNVPYTDCAKGEIKSVRVEPCEKDPCKFKVGDEVTVSVDFVANQNTSKASLIGTLRTGGFFSYEIGFPGYESEACGKNKLPCPLVAGKNYTFSYSGNVPLLSKFNIFRVSTWKLMGESYKPLTCAEIPIQ